jgi:hypothetical protein
MYWHLPYVFLLVQAASGMSKQWKYRAPTQYAVIGGPTSIPMRYRFSIPTASYATWIKSRRANDGASRAKSFGCKHLVFVSVVFGLVFEPMFFSVSTVVEMWNIHSTKLSWHKTDEDQYEN